MHHGECILDECLTLRRVKNVRNDGKSGDKQDIFIDGCHHTVPSNLDGNRREITVNAELSLERESIISR
jgi:hypothetical protein